jgi:hypothetical protein
MNELTWILATVSIISVVGVIALSVVYHLSMERMATRFLASERVLDRLNDPVSAPASSIEATSDIDEFRDEQEELERMEAMHMSKVARL